MSSLWPVAGLSAQLPAAIPATSGRKALKANFIIMDLARTHTRGTSLSGMKD
jgi:hypothetical protein